MLTFMDGWAFPSLSDANVLPGRRFTPGRDPTTNRVSALRFLAEKSPDVFHISTVAQDPKGEGFLISFQHWYDPSLMASCREASMKPFGPASSGVR